jgi:hypothetical protein
VNLTPWDSITAITIICTGRGTHTPRRLGEVDQAGIVVTIGGDKDLRRPAPRGSGMVDQEHRWAWCGLGRSISTAHGRLHSCRWRGDLRPRDGGRLPDS